MRPGPCTALNTEKSEKLVVTLLRETARIVEPAVFHYTRVRDKSLQRIVDHALSPKGQRERPLLVRLSCEAVGGKFEDIIPAAVAIELLHFSTLVIDDILDNSFLRGGEKTTFHGYGPEYAIIVGELLSSLSFQALNDLRSGSNDDLRVSRVAGFFTETHGEVYQGQYLDLSFEGEEDVTEKQYLDLVQKTTGSLIRCSLITGAILGDGKKNEIECLAKFGDDLGVAFQIRDDVADIIGDPQITGRQSGEDIRQRKMRLPFIKALACCKKSEKEFLRGVLKKRHVSENNVEKCIEILIESGSVEYSKKAACRLSLKAVKHLEPLPGTPAKDGLIAFAEIVGSLW